MDFEEAFLKAAAALNVRLPPKLPAAAAKGWMPGAAKKLTSMGIAPKAVSVGTEAAKTVLSSADYNYVLREAFREELAKLSHSPEAIEALSKLALQLGSMKEMITHVPGMIGGDGRPMVPATA